MHSENPDPHAVKMPSMFGMLVLELGSRCNRKCWFCMRQTSGARLDVDQRMPTHHARRLLWEASKMGFKSWVTFYLLSEPFLDPRLIGLAKYSRDLGMVPFVNTNGDALAKDPELQRSAADVFHHIEIGLYDKQAAESEKFWTKALGRKAVFKRMSAMGPRPHVPVDAPTFPKAKCLRPLEKLVVQYDGRSSLCCYDIHAEFGLPNAFHSSVGELWNHPARVDAYRKLREPGGRTSFELCTKCVMPEAGSPSPFGGEHG